MSILSPTYGVDPASPGIRPAIASPGTGGEGARDPQSAALDQTVSGGPRHAP